MRVSSFYDCVKVVFHNDILLYKSLGILAIAHLL